MARLLAALATVLLLGVGLALSQMVDPAKVLAFLDLAGAWDPSLGLVLLGAVAVSLVLFRPTLRRAAPLLDARVALPPRSAIDARLVAGSALFGVGWGLVGLCPGPAIASFAFARPQSLAFVAAMIVGAGLARLVPQRTTPGDAPKDAITA